VRAGHAAVRSSSTFYGLGVATRNVADFARVEGLRVMAAA
jgi:hypothetical protein